ncbi:MAG: hydrogenase maturation protease [Acidobacteriia bacterium]|nr:hydrogenase maturation protease [Terriglobia bacterium]
MPTCLILGYGNPLRSDDGVGWKAAEALERELSSTDLLVVASQQLTPEMAETLARCARVLFLDAAHNGSPGEIRMETIRRDPNAQIGNVSHQLLPPALLDLAYRHFAAEPDATLLTLTGENFEFGEHFSDVVEGSWRAYLDRARRWLNRV